MKGDLIVAFDYHASGRLSLVVNGGPTIRQERFNDSKRAVVEDQMPVVLQALGPRLDDAKHRDELRRRGEAASRSSCRSMRIWPVYGEFVRSALTFHRSIRVYFYASVVSGAQRGVDEPEEYLRGRETSWRTTMSLVASRKM